MTHINVCKHCRICAGHKCMQLHECARSQYPYTHKFIRGVVLLKNVFMKCSERDRERERETRIYFQRPNNNTIYTKMCTANERDLNACILLLLLLWLIRSIGPSPKSRSCVRSVVRFFLLCSHFSCVIFVVASAMGIFVCAMRLRLSVVN